MSRVLTIMMYGSVMAIAVTAIVLVSVTIEIPTDDAMEPASIFYYCQKDSFTVDYTEDDIISYPVGPFRTHGLLYNAYHFVTLDDPVLLKLYDAIQPCIEDMTDREKADYLCQFVYNSIYYTTDEEKHGCDEYFQYPSETILSETGDCDDFAILLYNLYRKAGLEARIVLTSNHALVAVDVGGYGDTIVPLLSVKDYSYADPVNYKAVGKGCVDGFEIAFSPTVIPLTEFLGVLAVLLGLLFIGRVQ